MPRAKRKGPVLPPIDATPEEIAAAMFTSGPGRLRPQGEPEYASSRYQGPVLTIRTREGSPQS